MQGVPGFTAERAFGSSLLEAQYACTPLADPVTETDRVYPQACSFWTAIGCVASIAACSAGCVAGGPAWLPCVVGCLTTAAPNCISCVT